MTMVGGSPVHLVKQCDIITSVAPGQTIKVRTDVDAIDEVPTYRGEGRNFE
jgi:hypothetical protein